MAEIIRRRSITVRVGGDWIGGDHPIAVQSMTNTDTVDFVTEPPAADLTNTNDTDTVTNGLWERGNPEDTNDRNGPRLCENALRLLRFACVWTRGSRGHRFDQRPFGRARPFIQ